jgi:hypothetical protein
MRSTHPFILCTSISSLGCSLDLVIQSIHIANTVTPLYAVFNRAYMSFLETADFLSYLPAFIYSGFLLA